MTDLTRIEAFLEMMSAERGAAQNTLDAYARDLLDASEFLGGQLCGASAGNISSWMQDLSARGLAASTSARRLSAVKRFFRFLFEEGDRKDNPTSGLDGPKRHRDVPDVLSREEMMRLIEACGEDVRLRCLVECLYGAGLRVSELVSLKLGELPRRKRERWLAAHVESHDDGAFDSEFFQDHQQTFGFDLRGGSADWFVAVAHSRPIERDRFETVCEKWDQATPNL